MRGFLVLIPLGNPAAASGHEWIAAGQSGYASTYHTQTWYDTLKATVIGPFSNTWQLGQRLDLLRKELSSGLELQQRNHRVFLAAHAPDRTLGWALNIDGDESSVVESVNRRTLWSRFLVGGNWRHSRTISLGLQVGGTASWHRAARETANDQGLAQRFTGAWNFSRPQAGAWKALEARARLTHDGDQRNRLASRQTEWSWEMGWQQPADSISFEWEERWGDTRFFPSPDRFDRIGRQSRRYRIARAQWSHAPDAAGSGWLPVLMEGFAWRGLTEAGLDRNSYQLSEGELVTGGLPGNVNATYRSYALGISRGLSGLQFDLDYRYRWSEESFTESRRDQTSETGELDAKVGWRLRAADSVGAHAVFRVTSYSVPGDASFFSDRDQGERVVDVYWWHRFSEVLTMRPLFSFRGFRQVFLSEDYSANNNTDNIYLLAPAIQWTPIHALAVSQKFGIRAHYRFFDFERTDPSGRGTLYRKAESVTGARVDWTAKTSWLIQYTYRYEDFGGLFDRDGWVQSVDWDRRSHLVDGHVVWRPLRELMIRPALGLERKRSYNHRRVAGAVRRIEDEPFRRTNISITAEWHSPSGFEVRLVMARRVQQFGSGSRDRDDRWEFAVTKGM